MINKKQLYLTLLLSILLLPVAAQQKADTAFVFRFLPGKDMLYAPWNGNGESLDGLLKTLDQHREPLLAGQMYLCVSSYAPTAGNGNSSERISYLRSSRVKSELITRGGITEGMFVTDRLIKHAYADSLPDVVVVTFPASVEKVAAIAGAEAAQRVKDYIIMRELEKSSKEELFEVVESPVVEQPKEAEPIAVEPTPTPVQPEAEPEIREWGLSLRANLLSWATLTPDLGVEWRIDKRWSVQLNGAWTSWSWDNSNRRYALWKVSPEVRYYLGRRTRGYVGAMYHVGEFNFKLSDTGRQGNYQGGGITGGYQLPLNRSLALDFHAGVGCTHATYEKYGVTNGVRVRQGNETKNYWGINQLGITLIWKIVK